MNLVEQIFDHQQCTAMQSHLALKWDGGSWSYQQLSAEIEIIGASLKDHGIKPNCRVVVLCADTPATVALFLAVLKIAGVAVFISSRVQKQNLAFSVRESNATLLIYDSTTADIACSLSKSELGRTKRLNIADLRVKTSAPTRRSTSVVRNSADEAFWVYSSGSTGRPKAIVHCHRDISKCCDFHHRILKLGPGQVVFCTSKLSFAYALANGLLVPLKLGVTIFLYPNWMTLDEVYGVIQKESPSVVFTIPSVYRGLLNRFDCLDQHVLSTPKHYVSAGEHLSEEIQLLWEKHTNRSIINAYGCSETLFLAFAANKTQAPQGSVGQPLLGVKARLIGESELPADASTARGVLHLSHPFLFMRYANQQDLTERRLSDGYFVTGDLFRTDSHKNWFYMGREDELIKVSGQWVYLREVESVAVEFESVADAVVVGAKDDMGMLRPAVFFISNAGQNQDVIDALKRFIYMKLPKVKRPSWIRMVDDFPRTPNGKISRHQLRMLIEGVKRD